jgi:hypothetical protein
MSLVATTLAVSANLKIIVAACTEISAQLVVLASTLSGICSAACSILPIPTADGSYAKFHKALNLMAFNFGNAANKLGKQE